VTRFSLRRRTLAASTAVFAVAAASALAATSPKPGFHYTNADDHGTTVNVITLMVAEDATLSASGSDPKCKDSAGSYAGFAIAKPIDASNGKFEFEGKANSTLSSGPPKVKVHLKGKFTSAKHSKGSYTLEGCSGKVKFDTDWTLGG
jgi:hypothetical protein